MGWETRDGKGRYYTRSRRVRGRVVREYVGGGARGELFATLDKADREKRRREREKRRREQDRLEAVLMVLSFLSEATDKEMKRVLGEAGYYYRKGEWRKRRKE